MILYFAGKSGFKSASSLGYNSKWQIGLSVSPSNSIISGCNSGSKFSNYIIIRRRLLGSHSVGLNTTENSSSHPLLMDPCLGPTL